MVTQNKKILQKPPILLNPKLFLLPILGNCANGLVTISCPIFWAHGAVIAYHTYGDLANTRQPAAYSAHSLVQVTLNLWSSCLYFPSPRFITCTTTSSLRNSGDRTQGLSHARRALYELSYILIPVFYCKMTPTACSRFCFERPMNKS